MPLNEVGVQRVPALFQQRHAAFHSMVKKEALPPNMTAKPHPNGK